MYAMCCDRTGKIVRNQQYYKEYKAQPHMGGKRGSKMDKI